MNNDYNTGPPNLNLNPVDLEGTVALPPGFSGLNSNNLNTPNMNHHLNKTGAGFFGV